MILNTAVTGDGAPLVLIHGLFGAARNFGAVQRALAPEARVIALDLRNHGSSPHAPVDSYDVMAADVLETLETAHGLPAGSLKFEIQVETPQTLLGAEASSPSVLDGKIIQRQGKELYINVARLKPTDAGTLQRIAASAASGVIRPI